ncbi:MAG TPA: hypothetical protein VG672_09965, partial [Bryobacteraceae bacterium]|nr:hypothetical protein [Bryobacteraceae bacterium]
MAAFEPNRPRAGAAVPERLRHGLALAASIAGLIATGWLLWSISILPRLDREPPAVVFGEALQCALAAWAWSAAITLALYGVVSRSVPREAIPSILRTSTTAVWFAPATILLSEFSPASLAAALVLIISATRLLYFHWREFWGTPEWPGVPPRRAGRLFDPPRLPILWRQLAPGWIVSLSLQAGMLVILSGKPMAAAALFAMSTAMLTFLCLAAGVVDAGGPASLPQSILGAALTVILAAGLTVGGLKGGGQPSANLRWDFSSRPRPGLWDSTRSLLDNLLYGEPPPASRDVVTRVYVPPAEGAELNDRGFPGVILLPQTKPSSELPRRVAYFRPGLAGSVTADPLSIPFSGEYWMFKPPYIRPPQRSYIRRGSPLQLSFVTVDHRPLMMEAYQRLEPPLDLGCCSKIQVAIENRDRYPGTLQIELILVLADLPGQPSQSLGRVRVFSRPLLGSIPL